MRNTKEFLFMLLALGLLVAWAAANIALWYWLTRSVWGIVGTMFTGCILPGFTASVIADLRARKRHEKPGR